MDAGRLATSGVDFVKLFLGPTLGRAGLNGNPGNPMCGGWEVYPPPGLPIQPWTWAGLGDKRLIVWDHNRDLMLDRAATILGDPAVGSSFPGAGLPSTGSGWGGPSGGDPATWTHTLMDPARHRAEACRGTGALGD
eukprot:EG_transcript_45464